MGSGYRRPLLTALVIVVTVALVRRSFQISLYDFVLGLLNYCLEGREYLSKLAFDVYDRHTSGTITEADLEGMLIDVWGPNW